MGYCDDAVFAMEGDQQLRMHLQVSKYTKSYRASGGNCSLLRKPYLIGGKTMSRNKNNHNDGYVLRRAYANPTEDQAIANVMREESRRKRMEHRQR